MTSVQGLPRRTARWLLLAAGLFGAQVHAGPVPDLRTQAEQSGFIRTGRYDEVIRLCADYARRWPESVRCETFGHTPESRPLLALIVSRSGALTPQAASARQLPVMLIQGGIHAGEIDGKDAGFLALREALENPQAGGVLEREVLVFVPVFNADGHERFGPWNRPNQTGPEQMGWRSTAQNLNLNRDYAKADAPEMQAMLGLINQWDPLVAVDLHVTDGAQFEHDVSITIEPQYSGDAALRKIGLALRKSLLDQLTRQGSLPLGFYPEFVDEDQPESGFAAVVSSPRYSDGYFVLRNRIGVLVETHSWKDYATRVRVSRHALDDLMALLAQHGVQWRRAAAEADLRAARLAGQPVPLDWKASEQAHLIDFRGYAYTRSASAISGSMRIQYDEHQPQIWRVPLRDDLQPVLTQTAPRRGYLVPPAQAGWLRERLALHGIASVVLGEEPTGAVQSFRATHKQFADESFEGHQRLTLQGQWKPEAVAVGAGWLLVPIDQPKARLVMALLEPRAPDSFAAWGFFNTAFEPKEYLEAYVAEDVARQMLAADPALASAFQQKLTTDPAFAASPTARLEFFARRHPSWDTVLDRYPVLRLE